MAPLAVSPEQAAAMTSLSRRSIFYALKGDLKSTKKGKRRLILVEDLNAWLTQQQQVSK